MFPQGEESSSRKLVRIEGQSFRGWGCSECAWVFHPCDAPIVKSLDEMNFEGRVFLFLGRATRR
jgi:hypothetical protein